MHCFGLFARVYISKVDTYNKDQNLGEYVGNILGIMFSGNFVSSCLTTLYVVANSTKFIFVISCEHFRIVLDWHTHQEESNWCMIHLPLLYHIFYVIHLDSLASL